MDDAAFDLAAALLEAPQPARAAKSVYARRSVALATHMYWLPETSIHDIIVVGRVSALSS